MARALDCSSPMWKRILVPVSFSPGSRAALEHAMMIGGPLHADIDVVHVWNVPPDWITRGIAQLRFVVSENGLRMREWLSSALCRPELGNVRGLLEVGDPHRRIVELANQYDVIILGTTERRGVARRLRRSVASSIVRNAPCPVLTVRPDTGTQPLGERTSGEFPIMEAKLAS